MKLVSSRPSAKMTRCSSIVREPFFAGCPTIVTWSPTFSVVFVHPARTRITGPAVSAVHSSLPPSAAAALKVMSACGFAQWNRVTVALRVVEWARSNAAAPWCASSDDEVMRMAARNVVPVASRYVIGISWVEIRQYVDAPAARYPDLAVEFLFLPTPASAAEQRIVLTTSVAMKLLTYGDA